MFYLGTLMRRKRRLYAKPTRAPRWWPRDGRGRTKFAGVISGGAGWVLGDGDPMTSGEIAQAKQMLAYWDLAKPRFKVVLFGKEGAP